MLRRTLCPTVLLAVATAACGGGSSQGTAAPAAPPLLQIEAAVVDGSADGLAAELLLTAAFAPASRTEGVADDELARDLDAVALDHLRSEALGGLAGPPLAGSALGRRLAAAPGAPRDQDGDDSNLREAMQAEMQRIVEFAGATLAAGTEPPLLPWLQRSPDLAAELPPGQSPPLATWRTVELGQHRARLLHLGGFLRARAVAARRLLLRSRPGRLGATADEGALGLLLVQQMQAAEETLFASLFTGGGALGGLEQPAQYDPAQGARWLPAEVQVEVGADAALAFRATDAASELEALAALTEAGAMFAALTRPDGPPPLASLFAGEPFKLPPSGGPPPEPVLSWSRDIGPLLLFRCGGCHSGVGEGGFVIDSYQQMLAGGNRTRAMQLPMLVPGDHRASFLHEVLTGPRAPFNQMPLGAPLPAAEVLQVDAWIDSGGREDPPTPPAPPRPGEDLARVGFVDLVALHLDASGALHHRVEADGPSGIATALATGRALLALTALDAALPQLDYQGRSPHDVLAQVAQFAAARLLAADGQARDAVSLDGGVTGGGDDADLQGQAALTAGLLAAATTLPQSAEPAARATARLLQAFGDAASGLFQNRAGGEAQRFDDDTLELLLAALRLGAARGLDGADAARERLLRRLLPVLAFSEWPGHGELLDGVADSDGDGLREPAAAGGAHGRLPLLAAALVVAAASPPPPAPITWSRHVRPLLLQKCGECHLGGNQQGDYRLDTRRLLAVPGESQGALPLLVPGSADASFLLQKLTQRRPALGLAMPLQRPPLDAKAIAWIRQWIDAGATSR